MSIYYTNPYVEALGAYNAPPSDRECFQKLYDTIPTLDEEFRKPTIVGKSGYILRDYSTISKNAHPYYAYRAAIAFKRNACLTTHRVSNQDTQPYSAIFAIPMKSGIYLDYDTSSIRDKDERKIADNIIGICNGIVTPYQRRYETWVYTLVSPGRAVLGNNFAGFAKGRSYKARTYIHGESSNFTEDIDNGNEYGQMYTDYYPSGGNGSYNTSASWAQNNFTQYYKCLENFTAAEKFEQLNWFSASVRTKYKEQYELNIEKIQALEEIDYSTTWFDDYAVLSNFGFDAHGETTNTRASNWGQAEIKSANSGYWVYCGSEIITNIPLYTYEHLTEMFEYLNSGDYSKADNIDVIEQSAIDLSTDWTIYINGNYQPTIDIECKSTGLESYLESTEGGVKYSAHDFKVDIEYQTYNPVSLEKLGFKTDSLSLAGYDDYPLATSWTHFVNESFPEGIGDIYDKYANFRMRVRLSDALRSAWAECNIGVCGNPKLDAFIGQNNYGIIQLPRDKSTIVLLYEEIEPPDEYEPVPPTPDGDKPDTNPLDSNSLGLNQLVNVYKISDLDLQALGRDLWGDSFMENIRLVNNSPIENIVGCKIMPCECTSVEKELTIGNVQFKDITVTKVTKIPNITIGSLNYQGYYNSFLDYAPYTITTLFLPFIGFIEIEPHTITGHKMEIEYSFDVIMGSCRAMIFIDGIFYKEFDAQCGVEVPLVASNRAQIDAALTARIPVVLTMGLVGQKSSALLAGENLIGDFATRQYHTARSNAYNSCLSWIDTFNAYLIVDICNAQYPSTYGHDIGYPCQLSMSLSECHGFTQTGVNVDLSGIPCTEDEKNMILELLRSGIYL